jgi:hypothetical protein
VQEFENTSGPGRTRTSDLQFRKPLLVLESLPEYLKTPAQLQLDPAILG